MKPQHTAGQAICRGSTIRKPLLLVMREKFASAKRSTALLAASFPRSVKQQLSFEKNHLNNQLPKKSNRSSSASPSRASIVRLSMSVLRMSPLSMRSSRIFCRHPQPLSERCNAWFQTNASQHKSSAVPVTTLLTCRCSTGF